MTMASVDFSYHRDPAGRLTKLINPDGQATTFTRDALNLLTKIEQANGSVVSQTYDDANRLTAIDNLNSMGGVISSVSAHHSHS